MKNCIDCRFSFIGDYNQPMVAAHRYETDTFIFVDMPDEEIIAVPVYELECENERNWLPSRGNMLIHDDDRCKYFEAKTE